MAIVDIIKGVEKKKRVCISLFFRETRTIRDEKITSEFELIKAKSNLKGLKFKQYQNFLSGMPAKVELVYQGRIVGFIEYDGNIHTLRQKIKAMEKKIWDIISPIEHFVDIEI